jgi:hypothetical protein
MLNSDTAPLNTNENGILFGYGAADTQFYIYHNDATGACVKDPTGFSIPAVNTNYIVEIAAFDSTPKFEVSLFSVTSPGKKGSLIGGSPWIVNTRIPGQVTGLYTQDLVMGSTTAVQANNIHYIEVH